MILIFENILMFRLNFYGLQPRPSATVERIRGLVNHISYMTMDDVIAINQLRQLFMCVDDEWWVD